MGRQSSDLLQHQPSIVDAAIISGSAIHPSDDRAQWTMPKLPTDQAWLDLIMEDVGIMGMESASALQHQSFTFSFTPQESLPPMLIVVGEEDTAMSKRDLEELTTLAKKGNDRSESKVLDGAWHNHPIDISSEFAALIEDWARKSSNEAMAVMTCIILRASHGKSL